MPRLGVDFPVAFEREWICFFRRPWPREPHPAGVDLLLHGHFRPDGGRATLFGGDESEVTLSTVPPIYERRASERRSPSRIRPGHSLSGPVDGGRALGYGCVDDVTPDWLPYLGRVGAVEGRDRRLRDASDFFKHAPAVGRGLAELVVDGRSELVDLSPLPT